MAAFNLSSFSDDLLDKYIDNLQMFLERSYMYDIQSVLLVRALLRESLIEKYRRACP